MTYRQYFTCYYWNFRSSLLERGALEMTSLLLKMNNTTVESCICVNAYECIFSLLIPHILSLSVRLPIHAYILLLLLSRQGVTSKIFQFNQTFVELLICLYDVSSIVFFYTPSCLMGSFTEFFQNLSLTQPFFMVLICAERYVAVARPLMYLKFKSLWFNLALSGLSWLFSLVCSLGILFSPVMGNILVVLLIICSLIKLYFCITTIQVLKQPEPGDKIGKKEDMNHMKLRAFKIILVNSVSVTFVYLPLATIVSMEGYLDMFYYAYLFSGFYGVTAISAFVQAIMFLITYGSGIPCFTCI
ncbi:uncharacterized protein LOC144198463 [Stigmatopora nigra]